MLFAISLIYVALFFVFKALARHFYRVTRRTPEDDQPWQYRVSVLFCWLSLAGFIVTLVRAVVKWAN